MTDSINQEANLYMKEYTQKIRSRFLDDVAEKKELLDALSDTERTPEKIKEINKQYHDKLKLFVDELKTDENFSKYQDQYRKDIATIRSLLNDTVGAEPKKLSELFPEAKETFFDGNDEDWNSFMDKLGREMYALKKEDKHHILSYLKKITSSKKEFMDAIDSFKTGFDTIQTKSKVWYISQAIFALLMTGFFATELVTNSNAGLAHGPWVLMSTILGAGLVRDSIKKLSAAADKQVIVKKINSYRHLGGETAN